MAYSDQDKRRATERERQKRYRARRDGYDVTPNEFVTPSVTPKDMASWVLLRGEGVKEGKAETGSQPWRGAPPAVATVTPHSGVSRKRVVMKNGMPCVVEG